MSQKYQFFADIFNIIGCQYELGNVSKSDLGKKQGKIPVLFLSLSEPLEMY